MSNYTEFPDIRGFPFAVLKPMQIDVELQINLLDKSAEQLVSVQQRFHKSLESLEHATQASIGKEVLVPVTRLMYVPGYVDDTKTVLVEIGCGYLVEKSIDDGKEYFSRRIEYIEGQLEQISSMLMGKLMLREGINDVLEDIDGRTCWVCFATDEDEPYSKWVRPCKCRGTTKWVHNFCLQRWFDEKQNGNPTVQVFCPQCNTEYSIRYPPLGAVLLLIDGGQKIIDKVCPIMTAGFVIGSLYWTAVTFGAVSVMQVMGHKRGLEIMEKADPLFLLVGLPIIPFTLILTKMIRWEDYLLQQWREQSKRWWILRKIFGEMTDDHYPVRIPLDPNSQLDFLSSTRVLCGALMMPTFATACGNYLFGNIDSPIKKTLLGGAVFIGLKGIIQMYYKQQNYTRLARRKIEDYQEPVAPVTPPSPTSL